MSSEYSKEGSGDLFDCDVCECVHMLGFSSGMFVVVKNTRLRAYLEKYKQMSDVLLSNKVKRSVTAQKQHQQSCKSTINLLKSHPHFRGNLGRSH